ncbi:MAG: protein kinase [Planctomycetota bacterium]
MYHGSAEAIDQVVGASARERTNRPGSMPAQTPTSGTLSCDFLLTRQSRDRSGAVIPDPRDELIRTLFGELLELDPSERCERLDAIGAEDAALAAELRDLLRHHDAPAPMLASLTETAARLIAADGPEPSPPDRIGAYAVEGVLGRGGMGIVYAARHEETQRRVAIKVLRPGSLTDSLQRRFRQEVHVLGMLNHPGIAQVHDAGTCDLGFGEQLYFVMELVEGRSLSASVEGLTTTQRVELVSRIADAVGHAHARGVVHRDLKPANIFVVGSADAAGGLQPKVLDFGIARRENETSDISLLTQHGTLLGTLAYMSPEQAAGEATGPAADVYSLGVLLYEALAGRLPHDLDGKSLSEALRILLDREPPPLRRLDRLLHGDLDVITRKAMAKEPAQRYAHAAELAADLRRFLRSEPIRARRATTWYQLRRFARRNRALTVSLLALGTVLATGAGGTALFALRADHNARLAAHNAERSARRAYAGAMLAASTQLRTHAYAADRALATSEPRFRGCEWHLMRAALDPADLLLEVSEGTGTALAWTAAGSPVVLSAAGHELTFLDVATRRVLARWQAPDRIRNVFISASGAKAATIHGPDNGQCHRLIVWSTTDGSALLDLSVETTALHRLAFSPDDRFMLTWCHYPGRPLLRVDLLDGTWTTFPASGSSGRTPILADSRSFSDRGYRRDLVTGARLEQLSPWDHRTTISPDGRFIAGVVRTHRRVYFAEADKKETWQDAISAMAGEPDRADFSADGSLLLSSSASAGCIQIHDVVTRRLVHELSIPCDQAPVLHPGGDAVMTRTPRGVEVLPVRRSRRVLGPHRDYVVAAAFSPDGQLVAGADTMGMVTVWDADTGERLCEYRASSYELTGLAFARDGLALFAPDKYGYHNLLDLATGSSQRIQGDHAKVAVGSPIWRRVAPGERLARAWALGRDDHTLASAEGVFDLRTGQLLLDKTDWQEALRDVPNQGGTVAQIQERLDRNRPPNVGLCLAVSDDGKLAATGYSWGRVFVWDLSNRRLLQTLRAHLGFVFALAFSPDGRLVTGGQDDQVRIWDPTTGDCLAVFDDHERTVESIAWSPDGTRFLTASGDRTVRVWDTIVGWQRGREAAARGQHESAMAERAATVLARSGGDKSAALRALWQDAGLSLTERQAARTWLLRH